jgi:hypothetical protein
MSKRAFERAKPVKWNSGPFRSFDIPAEGDIRLQVVVQVVTGNRGIRKPHSGKVEHAELYHEIGGCFTTTVETPEAAIAFPEVYIRRVFGESGLLIREPIYYGSWCGRAKFMSYQVIVTAHNM